MNPLVSTSSQETENEIDVRIYEFAVLLPYPMGQKEQQQAVKEIEAVFKEAGAREVSKDIWGARGLAYPIDGHNEGNFIVYHQEIDPAKIKEVDVALRIVPGVLRHIVVKPPKGYRIVKFSESYEQWLKERESASEKTKREREVEIQERVAEKAKRQVKRTERAKTEAAPETMSKEEVGKKLDQIISDDSLGI